MTSSRTLALALTALIGLCSGSGAQAGLVLDIASVVGANVEFKGTGTGGSFQFNNNGSGQGFDITSSSGVGDSTGLYGKLGGTYSYTTASIVTIGSVQTAPVVTSGGLLTITDASNHSLTGVIAGLDVTTVGTAGVVNAIGSINLTNVMYTGSNADLNQLKTEANANGGVFALTFQFIPGLNLSHLAINHADHKTSYSSTIVTAVPEPSSVVLGCMGTISLIGCSLWRRKVRGE